MGRLGSQWISGALYPMVHSLSYSSFMFTLHVLSYHNSSRMPSTVPCPWQMLKKNTISTSCWSLCKLELLNELSRNLLRCRTWSFSLSFSPTLCNPMDCSTPGFPLLHGLPEFAQTHVHWVNVTLQPSHPLSPPSPPALNLSQHQGLFQWVGSSGGLSIGASVSALVLPMNSHSYA